MPVTRVTWRDALEMPEDGNRYEAIGGELHVSPPPKPRHEWVSMNLVDALLRLLVHPGHGRVFTAPVGVEQRLRGSHVSAFGVPRFDGLRCYAALDAAVWPRPTTLASPPESPQIHDMTSADAETAILRRMTAARKLAVMHALWRQAWQLKTAGLRARHPEWPPEKVTARVRELFGGRPA